MPFLLLDTVPVKKPSLVLVKSFPIKDKLDILHVVAPPLWLCSAQAYPPRSSADIIPSDCWQRSSADAIVNFWQQRWQKAPHLWPPTYTASGLNGPERNRQLCKNTFSPQLWCLVTLAAYQMFHHTWFCNKCFLCKHKWKVCCVNIHPSINCIYNATIHRQCDEPCQNILVLLI